VKLHASTAAVLRYGVAAGIILIMIGLALDAYGVSCSLRLLSAGILVLILSPLFGIICAYICLMDEKDTKWVLVTTLLLMIIVSGVLLTYLGWP